MTESGSAAAQFRAAVEAGDVAAAVSVFSENVVFHMTTGSP